MYSATPPEPVPAGELPTTPLKPLPEPAAPAPAEKKELPDSAEAAFFDEPAEVEQATLESMDEPGTSELIQQTEFQRPAMMNRPRQQDLPSDSDFQPPVRGTQSPATKQLEDDEDNAEMDEEAEEEAMSLPRRR